MKHNAIIRIVLFSVTIVILLAILTAGLTLRHWDGLRKSAAASSWETAIPERLDSPGAGTEAAVMPLSPEAGTNAAAPTVSPEDGTEAAAPTLSPEDGTEAAAPTVSPAGENVQRFPADQIRHLKIEWASGSVVLVPGDVDAIEICESGSSGKYPMQAKQQNSKLTIAYCQDSLVKGIGACDEKKELTVCVPRNLTLDCLEVETASATLKVCDLTVREVEIDTASGECVLENCALEKLDLDTASADLYFSGTLDELECDAASGSVCAVLENVPRCVEMDAASGNLDLTLPEDAGFTVKIDGMSSDFSSDFSTTMQNGHHICGDGSCRIQMDAMSGDVIIRKATAHHQEHDGQ